MYSQVKQDIVEQLDAMRAAGNYKGELRMTTPQAVHVEVDRRGPLVNLCANNYLGLANHPDVVAAAKEALDRWGFGMASVRFICGTQSLHLELESRLSEFLGMEDTILFSSCFDANSGLFESLTGSEDTIISDQLNHASIIDGIRLCAARRLRYRNRDIDELESRLIEAKDARRRLIVTDGVFSMDGRLAPLEDICDLAERHRAMVVVDDSHAVGFVGSTGRGTHELLEVTERIDLLTGTLGKALGGGSGGYVAGRREIIELLRQRARPYLFSNSLAPPIVAASLRALELAEAGTDLRERLVSNTGYFRAHIEQTGLRVVPGWHPIVPVMIGDEAAATRFARLLVENGVYAVSFSYPVVPRGTARIRAQISAAHSQADLDFAVESFRKAKEVVS